MNKNFIKLCYEEFKKNDEKFPDDWTFEDYKKYSEECTKILEKENEKTSSIWSYKRDSQVFWNSSVSINNPMGGKEHQLF